MALIGTLRNKMGTWVVIFVFVAISAFVLNDLFSKQSYIFNRNDVGEIGGHTVSLEEYQQAVREQEQNYYLSYGREASERDRPLLQQQAWELLILKYAIQKQFDKVGVEVTSDEIGDMMWGKNVDPNIRQAFTDPQTGKFEKDRIVAYINQVKNMPEGSEGRVRWDNFQRSLRPGRLRLKYENLVIKTSYATTAEAEREYHNQSDVAEIKYLYVPYYAVSDSAVNITDDQLKAYYDKHKERYKTEQIRDINYVSIPVQASAADTLEIKNEFAKVAEDFIKAEDDSAYAAANTDGQTPYAGYTMATLPPYIAASDLVKGKMIGPLVEEGGYKLVKISKITTDTVYSAKASHILIKPADASEQAKKDAKEKARKILSEIKGGADFATKARENGTDGTAPRGGDLGWFSAGQMVKPFENAVFAATKPGLLNDVVETDFGYHIIDVTHVKTNEKVYVAMIDRDITPSDATTNEAYRKAENFANGLSGVQEFKDRAAKDTLQVQEATNLTSGERRISTIGEARQIIQWLFRDASVGKVSEVFDLRDQYVVAVMTNDVEKGYKPFDLVKKEIEPLVRKEAKGKVLIEKLSSLKGSLEEIAQAYGKDANVYSNADLKFASNAMQPPVGYDPEAVGRAFSIENGKRTPPFEGESGVLIIEGNKTAAPAIADYSSYKNTLEQNESRSSSYNIGTAIKENSDIVDKRYKFY